MARRSPSGNVAFCIVAAAENQWTKRDLLEKLGMSDTTSGQLMATSFIIRNTPETHTLVRQWRDLCEQYALIDDEPSVAGPEANGFREHRHDQSVWSLLRKQFGAVVLDDETFWDNEWEQKCNFPIHARRLFK